VGARPLPRLVATDLDGTLLRGDGTLSGRTRDALAAVVTAGLSLVLVTARPPRYLTPLAPLLPPPTMGICANGALTFDRLDDPASSVRALPPEVARRVAATLAAAPVGFAASPVGFAASPVGFAASPVGFAVETGASVVFEPAFAKPDNGDVRLAVASLEEMWHHGRPIVKLLAWSATRSAGDLLVAARSALGPSAECTHSGGVGLLEISAPGVTKASALQALCTARGIAAEDVVAFGDMPNDLPMLEWAGRSYAVANAHPAVRAAASAHTAANDDDGVALVLERLLAGP
jgi:hydroxymethylpyrimidine pyrophosphatase-like HAD family hydrolase